MKSLNEIINGCKKRDERAEHELYRKFSAWLLGVSMRYCSNRPDAEDVLQEVFVKVYNAIPMVEYHNDAQFYAWMKTICVNTALTFIKRKITFSAEIDDCINIRAQEDNETESNDTRMIVLDCLQRLPHGYRTVINLYVFEEKNHKEIAVLLGISESTSKTQLFKARKMMKQMLDQYGIKNEVYER